jgi:hypothetical protein
MQQRALLVAMAMALVTVSGLADFAFAERLRHYSKHWVLNRSTVQRNCITLSVSEFKNQMRIDDQARKFFYYIVYEPLSRGCPSEYREDNKRVVVKRFSRFTLQDEQTITVYFDEGPCTIRYDDSKNIDSWRSEQVEPEGSDLANCFP